MINFPGGLKTFKKKDDEEVIDEAILLEVTDVGNDGTIEVCFDDRDERCYVKFRLQDLIERVCKLATAG